NDRGAGRRPVMPDLTNLLPDGPFIAESPTASAGPRATASELNQAVDAASAALAKYEQIPKEASEAARQAFVELYGAAGEVGRVVSYLDPSNAELSDSIARMQTLLDALSGATGVSRVRPIKFLAAQRWSEQASGQGLLAA